MNRFNLLNWVVLIFHINLDFIKLQIYFCVIKVFPHLWFKSTLVCWGILNTILKLNFDRCIVWHDCVALQIHAIILNTLIIIHNWNKIWYPAFPILLILLIFSLRAVAWRNFDLCFTSCWVAVFTLNTVIFLTYLKAAYTWR